MTRPSTFTHYAHTPEALADACRLGAASLREEATEALKAGDQRRHDRKTAAAARVDVYADTVQAGKADLDQAQVVAHAANLSGILMDPRMPERDHSALRAEVNKLEREYVQTRKDELASAAGAGLLSRVDDPGQLPYYALSGYEPDGYDPATQTSSLSHSHAVVADVDEA